MFSILAAIGTLASVLVCYQIHALRRQIAAARSTGLDYVILPVDALGAPWALAQSLFLPLLNRLPERWTEKWLPFLQFTRAWHFGYEPFKAVGADTFVAVSPSRNIVYTCDPDVAIHFLRGNTFEKPSDLLALLNSFGPTLTGSIGEEGRLYRKITAPFFDEKTFHQVWTTSIDNADALLKVLTGPQASEYGRRLRLVLARMTLHILNRVCFEDDRNSLEILQFKDPIPPGHGISYSQAMEFVLDHFASIFVTPSLILKNSPLQAHKKASQGYFELRKYMEEIRDRKKAEIREGKPATESSLLDLIVRAGETFDEHSQSLLRPDAVLGNIFIFMFAGHETNANTLMFIILLLACNPSIQESLQKDIDRILGSQPASQWSYNKAFPLLMESFVGAVINEGLRLFTVLPYIPKTVTETPQPVVVNGRTHVVPANTLVLINTSAVHRHPQHWPDPPGRLGGNKPHPVAAFNPSRWFQHTANGTEFLHPKPGSFIPFSDGPRACLGRRFGLVELCALVTRIFSEYSVELAVEGLGPDASRQEKRTGWERARSRAEDEMSSGVAFATVALRLVGTVPISFVKRGQEKFAGLF